MPKYKTHLTTLQKSATACPSAPLFKIPQLSGDELEGWKDVSYSQFLHDVEQSARYWGSEFSKKDVSAGSVIALWSKGTTYLDILHIWGISRAGYVPQLISARLTSYAVVRELLTAAGAKGLIYEPAISSCDEDEIFVFSVIDVRETDVEESPLPEIQGPTSGEDVVFILHSSGSTSGRPKLVPLTAKWLDHNIDKARYFTFQPPDAKRQEVITAGGSFCHIASMFISIAFINRGACVVLSTSVPWSLLELRRMVQECGVTALNMFSSFMCGVIREARNDSELLAMLRGLDACVHGGLPLEENEGSWAREQGIKLFNIFASTELCVTMIGKGGERTQFLQPWPESQFELRPLSIAPDDNDGTANDASGQKLVELVVPRDSPDCPHHSLCDKTTGEFRTGDIFLEVEPGRYLARGRNDDWIKMEISLRCDTRSIEDNALETCGDSLINAAVVVGAGRPSPALVVEAKQRDGHEELRAEILRRITPFHDRRYTHERILDPRLIIVVPNDTLPRTPKGSIKRMMVDREWKSDLDRAYSTVYS